MCLDVCESYQRTYVYFNVDIHILNLGGPEVCQNSFPGSLTFDASSSPIINVSLCGLPQPDVKAFFLGQMLNIKNETVNSYTHNFTLQLPVLTQLACGRELTIAATGYNGTLSLKIKIRVKNCKYVYFFSSGFCFEQVLTRLF